MADQCGGLWVHTWEKDGRSGKYFSGSITIDDVRYPITISRNIFKGEDDARTGKNHPEYKVFKGKNWPQKHREPDQEDYIIEHDPDVPF